ncbi:acyl carrier protein [Agaribacter marinus]|uniref:Acyl carrier protein n=1 Tax=Agaribacter marinus TaxID=1431249 RepID=A0AA37T2Y4_9ALTE|nr:acyl carrier protein [Agaribacter marinus]GLR70750.1 acyl carrier protein [Agaribacter marinus]
MSTEKETFQKISYLFEDLFEIDPSDIKPESNLYEDLDIDSIDAVDLVVELRKMTGIKIKPEDFKSVRTVNDIVEQIDKLAA